MPLGPATIKRESVRRLSHLERQAGDDVRRMRLDANVTLAELARATMLDPRYLARIETGTVHPSNAVLVRVGVALGADLSLRYFPGSGPRIHDRFQAPMIEALLRTLDQRWQRELEVPVLRPSRGVIDLVLRDPLTIVATEVYSDLRRLEQQVRWSAEKADGLRVRLDELERIGAPHQVSRLLVLRSTVATRSLAMEYRETLAAAYPARSAAIHAALTMQDVAWPGPGILWIHLHGKTATVMRHPPPGVTLGR